MTARKTPQIRDYVSYPANQCWLRDFLRKVAEEEGLSISDTYALGAAHFWSTRYPKLWKDAATGNKREALLRAIGG